MEEPATHDQSGLSRYLESIQIQIHNELNDEACAQFYEPIPTLESMASFAVAIESWRRVLNNENPERAIISYEFVFARLNEKDETKVKEIIKDLLIPRSVRENVENYYVGPVMREMSKWAYHYAESFFKETPFQLKETITVFDLKFCHWLPNGEIDYRRSALNMLSNPRMTLEHKFVIAYKYCLEDEIKKLPIESIPEKLIIKIKFYCNPLMWYWLCSLKGNQDELLSVVNGERVESFMITAWETNTWSAIEYFWNRLTSEEQTSKLEQLLELKYKFQKQLFFIMNESQRLHLFSKKPVQILTNFLRQSGEEQFAMTTWIYIKPFISPEDFELMWEMLMTEYYYSNMNERIECMVYIWDHCPDHLKKVKFRHRIMGKTWDYFSPQVAYRKSCESAANIKFLIAYFSDASAELRKKFMFEKVESVARMSIFNPRDGVQLLKLCLPNDEDLIRFKNLVLESEHFRCQLVFMALDRRDCESLDTFLDRFFPDFNSKIHFYCETLEIFIGIDKNISRMNWIDLIKFIDKHLLAVPDKALNFKKRIALSFAKCPIMLKRNDDPVAQITQMMEMVSQILDAKELEMFKRDALAGVCISYRWSKFDENVIGGFISWCCNHDDRRVKEFKKRLPIDNIINKVWHDLWKSDYDKETVFEVLETLDKCLLWACEDIENKKEFKKMKFRQWCRENNSMYRRYCGQADDDFVKKTEQWFFDGDEAALNPSKRSAIKKAF